MKKYIEYIKEEKIQEEQFYVYFNNTDIIYQIVQSLKKLKVFFDLYINKNEKDKNHYKFGIVIPFQKNLEIDDINPKINKFVYTFDTVFNIKKDYIKMDFEKFLLNFDSEKFGL